MYDIIKLRQRHTGQITTLFQISGVLDVEHQIASMTVDMFRVFDCDLPATYRTTGMIGTLGAALARRAINSSH
jgi:hypothetical protein